MSSYGDRYFGTSVPRKEDPRLLSGHGCYLDDIGLPGILDVAFVRSSHAHAFVKSVDTTAARSMEGVVAVYVAADLEPHLESLRLPIAFPAGQMPSHAMPYVLTAKEVVHVGECIAMVIARSRQIAEDAADVVVVELDPLPAIVDAREVLEADAPVSRMETGTNAYDGFSVGYGDCDTAFGEAAYVFSRELSTHRGLASSIEGRGALARFERSASEMTVWSSTQIAHDLARTVSKMLRIDANRVRVITPDVGGAFGAKRLVYPEEIAVAAAARILGRPVKWVEDRREHFLSAIQQRDQFWSLEIAFDAEATILGIRGRMVHDQGAYAPAGNSVPFVAATALPGPYRVPNYELEVVLAQTNKVPVAPVRGAGYPQGNFPMERLMDCAARELALDRAEIRRRNLIPARAMPYVTRLKRQTGAPVVYDSGDYLKTQERGLTEAGYADFAARQSEARSKGRYIGMGIAHAVKGTGRGPFESVRVRVSLNGRVAVYTSALEMGQGIKTSLAQICADELGVSMEAIDVVAADTGQVPGGPGGFASRQAVMAGNATLLAARQVRKKAVALASHRLRVKEGALEVVDGRVRSKREEAVGMPLAEIAAQCGGLPGIGLPPSEGDGLEATHVFRQDALAYANGFHVCEVEVDIETGGVGILRYVATQNCGRLINPTIATGQIHGSIAHGIGNALFEWMGYDKNGQPVTTTFADYLLPTAADIPHIETIWLNTPSNINPLGIKGVGEAGIVCVGSVLASAIEDALVPFHVQIGDLPIKPMRLLELIDRGRGGFRT